MTFSFLFSTQHLKQWVSVQWDDSSARPRNSPQIDSLSGVKSPASKLPEACLRQRQELLRGRYSEKDLGRIEVPINSRPMTRRLSSRPVRSPPLHSERLCRAAPLNGKTNQHGALFPGSAILRHRPQRAALSVKRLPIPLGAPQQKPHLLPRAVH